MLSEHMKIITDAKRWAKDCIGENSTIGEAERPYAEAALVEAACFEVDAPKHLHVQFSNVSDALHITLRGYTETFSIARWVQTFMGSNRSAMLQHIVDTRCSLPEKCIYFVCQKVTFDEEEARLRTRVSSSRARIDAEEMRLIKEWAEDRVAVAAVSQRDAAYVRAVLVEAACFENPPKKLKVDIKNVGATIHVAIEGYIEAFSLLRWVKTFLDSTRHEMLNHVQDARINLAAGCIYFIIDKDGGAGAAHSRPRKRRPANYEDDE